MNVTRERLTTLLAQRGLTQVRLAAESRVAYRTIHNILTGQSKPRPSIIGRIAEALNVTPEYLLGSSPSPDAPHAATRPTVYPEARSQPMLLRDGRPAVPADIHGAILLIAQQLHVPETRVADRVADLVRECVNGGKEEKS